MSRTIRSPSRSRRFIIVTTLGAMLAAGGVALAADPFSVGGAGDGTRVTRPGNGPGHDFVDRSGGVLDRMLRVLGVDDLSRLLGRSAASCHVCPAPPAPVERPLPPPRPNRNRPRNQGADGSSQQWMLPR